MSCHDCIGCPYATKEESTRVVTAFDGRLTLYLSQNRVSYDGIEIKMHKSRVRILAAFALAPSNDVVSMDRLKLAVWGDDEPTEATNLMRVHLTAIRQHFRKAGIKANIVSSYGIGWTLRFADANAA